MKVETMYEWFNERNKLRNIIIEDVESYNNIGQAVYKILESQNITLVEDKISLYKENDKVGYIFIRESNEYETIYVFKINPSKNINVNIKKIKDKIKDSFIQNSEDFMFSIVGNADFNSKIEPLSSLKNIDVIAVDKNDMEKMILAEKIKDVYFVCGDYIEESYYFYQLLNTFINDNIDIESLYKKSIKKDVIYASNSIKGLSLKLDKILSIADKKVKEFYHDIFQKDGFLFIQDYDWRYVVKKDYNGINIFWDNNKGSSSKFIKDINMGKIGMLPYKNTTLRSINQSIVHFDKNDYIKSFIIRIDNIYVTLLENKLIEEISYPENINSFDYQLRYQNTLYSCSKFEMIAAALLTNGGGFNYSEKDRALVYHRCGQYIENLPEVMDNTEDLSIISFYKQKRDWLLNQEWINALEYFLNTLKTKRPLPLSHDYDSTKEEALEKAIDFCEDLLLFNKI